MLTVRQAAALIGCSPRHLRLAILQGKIAAKTVAADNRHGFEYRVPVAEARRFRDTPVSRKGWPRGKAR